MTQYTLTWQFRNEHEWSKTFASDDERWDFTYRCGLQTHPDIVRITKTDPNGSQQVIKDVTL
jgi:hypothetical protein